MIPFIALWHFSFIILSMVTFQSKNSDVLGYSEYKWGLPIQKVLADFQKQNIDYKLSKDPTWPNTTDVKIHTGVLLYDNPGFPWVIEKTFVFYRDSLIKVILVKNEPLAEERERIYKAFKRILTEKYGNNFRETVLYRGKPYEGPYCEWQFKTTSISLTDEGYNFNYVRVLYELNGIDKHMEREIKEKSKTDF